MKAGYKVLYESQMIGNRNCVIVENYPDLNEVVLFYRNYPSNFFIDKYSVGVWKIKNSSFVKTDRELIEGNYRMICNIIEDKNYENSRYRI